LGSEYFEKVFRLTLSCFDPACPRFISSFLGFPMSTNLFVGNFPYGTKEYELLEIFSQVGEVDSVSIMSNDRQMDRFRSFGFVRMPKRYAETAIGTLNGVLFKGRRLTVKVASPRPTSPRPSNQARPEDVRPVREIFLGGYSAKIART
jgi:RNA recognition motif-containing protein